MQILPEALNDVNKALTTAVVLLAASKMPRSFEPQFGKGFYPSAKCLSSPTKPPTAMP